MRTVVAFATTTVSSTPMDPIEPLSGIMRGEWRPRDGERVDGAALLGGSTESRALLKVAADGRAENRDSDQSTDSLLEAFKERRGGDAGVRGISGREAKGMSSSLSLSS